MKILKSHYLISFELIEEVLAFPHNSVEQNLKAERRGLEGKGEERKGKERKGKEMNGRK